MGLAVAPACLQARQAATAAAQPGRSSTASRLHTGRLGIRSSGARTPWSSRGRAPARQAARAGRPEGEPPAGVPDDLLQLMPDPLDNESLLDEDDPLAAGYVAASNAWADAGSGSDAEWAGAGGAFSDTWLLQDYDFGADLGGGGLGGGAGGGGMGLGGDSGFMLDQLRSQDPSDDLVNEVGEGSSFRQEQRERYGAPLLNMTQLAHASEEELLLGAEKQALLDFKVEQIEEDAMLAHHAFKERNVNKYFMAGKLADLIDEIEYDDFNSAVEGDEQALPSWARAKFALGQHVDELEAEAAATDEAISEGEMQFFQDRVDEQLQLASRGWFRAEELQITSYGQAPTQAARRDALDVQLSAILPGTTAEGEAAERERPTTTSSEELLAAVLEGTEEGLSLAPPAGLAAGGSGPAAGDPIRDPYLAALKELEEDDGLEGGVSAAGDEEEDEEEGGVAAVLGDDDEDGLGGADDDGLELAALAKEAGELAGPLFVEEEEEGGAAGGRKRRKPVLGAEHNARVQASAATRERHHAEVLGLGHLSGHSSDPLLDILDRHKEAS